MWLCNSLRSHAQRREHVAVRSALTERRSRPPASVLEVSTLYRIRLRGGHAGFHRYREGGVVRRPGHTEASVDLARLAGCFPAGTPSRLAMGCPFLNSPSLNSPFFTSPFLNCPSPPGGTPSHLAVGCPSLNSPFLPGGSVTVRVVGETALWYLFPLHGFLGCILNETDL